MPSPEVMQRLIARVEANAHVEAIEEFYAPHASMHENEQSPRTGRDTLVANEKKVLSRARSVTRNVCVRRSSTATMLLFAGSSSSSSTMALGLDSMSWPTSAGRKIASSKRNFSTIHTNYSRGVSAPK